MIEDSPTNIDDQLFTAISRLSGGQKQELLKLINDLQFKKSEKRIHRRKKHLAQITYATPTRSVNGFIQDISECGVYIEPNGPFAEGQLITLTFEHPSENRPIKIAGKIVRRGLKGIGVRFGEPIHPISD